MPEELEIPKPYDYDSLSSEAIFACLARSTRPNYQAHAFHHIFYHLFKEIRELKQMLMELKKAE